MITTMGSEPAQPSEARVNSSRRRFLKTLGLAGAGTVYASGAARQAAGAPSAINSESEEIPRRTLGSGL